MAARRIAGCLAAALLAAAAHAWGAQAGSADGLHARHAQLRGQLGSNQFQKPLYLDSSESANGVAGNAYALVDHPFAISAAVLSDPGDWCEILILSINTKFCRASAGSHGSILNVSIGSKIDQPLDQVTQLIGWS